MLVPYYFKMPLLDKAMSDVQNWVVVIAAFAMGYGALNLTIFHIRKISRRDEGWLFSIVLLAAMYAMIVAGSIPPFLSHPASQWIYTYMQIRINVTIYALLAPFIASAAYRAFKVRGVEGSLMFVSALLVMLGNAPITTAAWGGFKTIGDWVYTVPNMAAQRGIMIGIAIGAVALGLRTLLGYERASVGEAAGGGS